MECLMKVWKRINFFRQVKVILTHTVLTIRKTHNLLLDLIFHCHGGGGISQTSKSHESYLRKWSQLLKVPVVSVDYSLCPEAPFPRAIEEIVYAYGWVLNNLSFLGTTGTI